MRIEEEDEERRQERRGEDKKIRKGKRIKENERDSA